MERSNISTILGQNLEIVSPDPKSKNEEIRATVLFDFLYDAVGNRFIDNR